jgi:hypothetical protein
MQRNNETGLSIYCRPQRKRLPDGRIVPYPTPPISYKLHRQLALAGMAAVGLMGVAWPQATEAQEVNLGAAAGFAVLAHESITNTGDTVIGNPTVKADIGVSPGTSITGFDPPPIGPGIVVPRSTTTMPSRRRL